jgi:hypothetical protein
MGVGGERRGWSLVDDRQETANGVGKSVWPRLRRDRDLDAGARELLPPTFISWPNSAATFRAEAVDNGRPRNSRPNGQPRRPCSSLSSEAADFGFRLSTTQVFDRFFGDFR